MGFLWFILTAGQASIGPQGWAQHCILLKALAATITRMISTLLSCVSSTTSLPRPKPGVCLRPQEHARQSSSMSLRHGLEDCDA
ncbi:hypothetical protein M422DRAFT_23786 [Sphaerobolus stellatus SS14]|nr:hypothetical protein M422DRAFT_23786 [Sphaerobolus stellatus SS14]